MANQNREKSNKLTKKYRFAIMEDESHKNLFGFRANRLSVIIGSIASFLIILTLVLVLIAYTPIRQLIPGYPSAESKRAAIQNAAKVDSLERELSLWSIQLTNIQRIVTGNEPLNIDSLTKDNSSLYNKNNYGSLYTKDDSLLRDEIMKQEQFNLSTLNNIKIEQIEGLLFFPPVKGVVTEPYNKAIGHPYIDVASTKGSIVSSVLDGTIISAGWTDDAGYAIQIQHSNDLVSIYKHNSKLLKKTGDKVTAGTPISLVGDTGSLSTGPHLHFELWHKGEPIDPSKYINF